MEESAIAYLKGKTPSGLKKVVSAGASSAIRAAPSPPGSRISLISRRSSGAYRFPASASLNMKRSSLELERKVMSWPNL